MCSPEGHALTGLAHYAPGRVGAARGVSALRDMRIGTLQWVMGVFCAITGILMVVAPHQYRIPEYAALKPYLPWSGGLMILAGAALLGVATVRARGAINVVAHLLGAAALLALAGGFVESGIWTGTVEYTLLALATSLAPLLASPREPAQTKGRGDLFALAIGAATAINGLLFLVAPQLYSDPLYDVPRPYLGWYGAIFLSGGLALVVTQIRPQAPRLAVLASYWLVAGAFYAFGLPNAGKAAWTGIAYFGGFGAILVLLPWLAPRLSRIDISSLRARLALSLAAATAIPLLLIVAAGAEYSERQAESQVLVQERDEAGALAHRVADRVSQRRSMVEVLAAYPGLLNMKPEAQRGLLRSLDSAAPSAAGFVTLDPFGNELARSGDLDLALLLRGMPGFPDLAAGHSVQAGSAVALQPASARGSVIVYWAPLFDQSGRFAGSIAAGIDATHLSGLLSAAILSADEEAFLVDSGKGVVLAGSRTATVNYLEDLSAIPPVAAMSAGQMEPGAVDYVAERGEKIAGYARVPGLDWGVVVQHPRASALAGVLAGRDLASLIVLLVLALGLAAGAVIAGFLIAPLGSLSRAVERLGAGDLEAPLPRSGITEVARLADVFGEMRDRLAARTAEQERAEDALRFLAEASGVLSSSLDYQTTLASVARLVVPRVADWCVVGVIDEEGTPHRVVVAHADPVKEQLLRDLHRRYPLEKGQCHPLAAVMRTGEPWLMEKVSEELLVSGGVFDEFLRIVVRDMELNSSMAVPLSTGGRTLGAMLLATGPSGRVYGQADLALAQDLARRCALAVDNARLYQEAQEAIRARDEFLSVAAHELKTPITSLRGFAQVTIRHLQKEGTPDPLRLHRALEVIDLQSEKLTRLVVQLLDVARIQAGRLVLHREQADLSNLVAGVVANAQASTSKHNLILRAPSSAWASVDPIRLEQVVTNLVDNAVKYSPGGGDIEVELSIPEPGAVKVSVRDHGIGIPSEIQTRIFERFYQVDDGSYAGGMGLGLYISRHIVDLHGGRIEVECPHGGGTRFVVSLPTNGNAH